MQRLLYLISVVAIAAVAHIGRDAYAADAPQVNLTEGRRPISARSGTMRSASSSNTATP